MEYLPQGGAGCAMPYFKGYTYNFSKILKIKLRRLCRLFICQSFADERRIADIDPKRPFGIIQNQADRVESRINRIPLRPAPR